MAADWVATRPIDFPLGSGVWAFQPGDPVPDGHVKAYGYDKVPADDGGPYVTRSGPQPAPAKKAAPKKAARKPHADGGEAADAE